MRTVFKTKVSKTWAEKIVFWLDQYDSAFCFRGKGWSSFGSKKGDLLAGFGEKETICTFENPQKISDFVYQKEDFIVCHLTYDLKNRLEKLQSNNADLIDFPELQFTIPKVVFALDANEVSIHFFDSDYSENQIQLWINEIENFEIPKHKNSISETKYRVSKPDYLNALSRLKREIKLGNIYQANYCQEVFWEKAEINAAEAFNLGFASNPNPFSVFYKVRDHYCLSFSPERFIAIEKSKLISQPMKGTAPRNADPKIDEHNKQMLRESEKDRRENVMIVDMVRNDLSHFAKPGSVRVPELYRIETYPRVHQMYSTVEADLKDPKRLMEALLKCFPMGSMTGAPKISAMQLIEETEHSKRGMFSGTIGFFTPEKSGDFNVIIRSLIYNNASKKLSCHVGGGITDMSDIEAEYEECLVKLNPILQLIQQLRESAHALP